MKQYKQYQKQCEECGNPKGRCEVSMFSVYRIDSDPSHKYNQLIGYKTLSLIGFQCRECGATWPTLS